MTNDFDPGRDMLILIGAEAEAEGERLVGEGYAHVVALETADLDVLSRYLHTLAGNVPIRAIVMASRDVAVADVAAAAEMVEYTIRGLRRRVGLLPEQRGYARHNIGSRQYESISKMDGRWRGRAAISIMPGPSLDKNVADLAAVRDCKLVAAMQSARPLKALGIRPHGIVVVDPNPENVKYLAEETYDFAVLALTLAPDLFHAVRADRVYACTVNGPADDWLYREHPDVDCAPLAGGGNVATNVFALFVRWGVDPIVLLGHDFAFEGEKSYADATPVEFGRRDDLQELDLPSLAGGTVRSSRSYADFKWWIEQAIPICGRQVINCTASGAAIRGARHTALTEFQRERGG